MNIKVGDRVKVNDPGLDALTAIFVKYEGGPPAVANNTGVVEEIDDEYAIIIFDDSGSAAPYPLSDVEPI